ncbi:MAG: hypothetical protein Q4F67_06560, partial [Propionibacteriaceae bacterium]|nr:hypothetical protein [Propionibacteriaceae bacterium]
RTRRQVADALALPVFAEIPRRRREAGRGSAIALIDQPNSAEADGYRVLRSAVGLTSDDPPPLRPPPAAGAARRTSRVIVVTSLSGPPDETVANLAAGLGEDRQVVVLDGDLRHPVLHEWFDVPNAEGLSDYLADPDLELSTLARPTRIPQVQLLTAGSDLSQPMVVVSQLGKIIAAAGELADVVIVKAPPLLAASEAFELLPLADLVLVHARSGNLERARAARARELLHRYTAAEAGVVLVGMRESIFLKNGNQPFVKS